MVREPCGAFGCSFECQDAGIFGDLQVAALGGGEGELEAEADQQESGAGVHCLGAHDAGSACWSFALGDRGVKGALKDVASDGLNGRVCAHDGGLPSACGGLAAKQKGVVQPDGEAVP